MSALPSWRLEWLSFKPKGTNFDSGYNSGNEMAAHDQQLSQIQGAIAQQQQDLTSVRAEVLLSRESSSGYATE